MRKMLLTALMATWIPGGVVLAAAGTRNDGAKPTFERDVRPILKTHCFQCHGEGGNRQGNLDLRLRRFMLAGGDSGPAIQPGKPKTSLLLARIHSGEMPPGNKSHMSKAEVAAIERWITAGAPTARPEPETLGPALQITPEERAFWSFQPIRRPTPPAVKASGRVRTPIDAFLLARLEKEGLTFSPEADRATLIRRATFDLLGLPPSPAEVDAFVADRRPDAYERLIDTLLASPRYGERWGRHWLDVAGYADSEGYNEADTPRADAYPYRDYVIRSFNADKPFDQFIREQLAGDEMVTPPYRNLTPDAVEKLTATGFLRMAPDGTGSRNDDPELARNAVVTETVKIVSSSLLGLTVGCAECHDHRYDPILQKDFYRMRALFEPALDWKQWREPRKRQILLLTDAQQAEAKRLEAEAVRVEAELKPQFEEFRKWVFEREVEQIPETIRETARAAGLAWQADRKKVTPEQTKLLDQYPGLKVTASPQILNLFLAKYDRAEDLQKVIQANKQKADAIRARKPREEFIRALTEIPGHIPTTYLFQRGDRNTPGEAVGPGDLNVLADPPLDFPADDPAVPTTGRRLAFARRLTDGSHPLLARVLVNRFWMHHFGRGIVTTPGDFGTQGSRPTHPELLDWLASSFVAGAGDKGPGAGKTGQLAIDSGQLSIVNSGLPSGSGPQPPTSGSAEGLGWSLKKLHRLIMTSTVYRQVSTQNERGNRVDADNTLYWRMPVRRLEAEAIRDAALAVSGKLNLTMFGPPVPVVLDDTSQAVVGGAAPSKDGAEFRRSVYVQVRRTQPAYLLEVFDAPQLEPNCEARTVSTVPQQSLVMLNNAFLLQQAEHFARRVRQEAGPDRAAQVRHAWRLAFSKGPAEAQVTQLTDYLQAQTQLQAARIGSAAKERSQDKAGQEQKEAGDPELSALASLCQVLLSANPFLYVD